MARLAEIEQADPPVGKQVVVNIRAEQHLPAESFARFLAELGRLSFGSRDWSMAFRTLCARYELQGEEVTDYRPGLLGRAVAQRSFFNYVREKNSVASFQRDSFERRFLRFGFEEQKRYLGAVKLCREGRVTFATFDRERRDRDPFRILDDDPGRVRNAFGLGHLPPGAETVVLLYSPPPSEALRFPTVCDAGATQYFRPADEGQPHGWTRPLSAAEEPMPEVVHENMGAQVIVRPVRALSTTKG